MLDFNSRNGRVLVDWHTIANYVQVGVPEIEDALSSGILNIGILDVPFLRDCPIEGGRAEKPWCITSGMWLKAASSVSDPLPVILRQMGYILAARSYISRPLTASLGARGAERFAR